MFRNTNPFDEIVSTGRDCLAAIQKRLINKNANVVLYSLTLCESLAKNCGLKAQREISSRAFTSLLVKTLNEKTTHPAVRQRILELIQQWAFEFRADPSLGIMDETYHQLRSQSKFKFPSPQKPKKELKSEADKRKEEEELQLALALSLSEHSEKQSTSKPSQHPEIAAPVKRVRALYDFEPTESGELGFQKDDIIVVLATSYQDWWKGELYGRQGIFPVNYVEEIKEGELDQNSSSGDDEAHVLHEAKNIDALIRMLQNVDPRRDNFSDNETLQDTYNNVLGIRPKLVELIKKHGEKKDEMLILNEKLLRARSTYEKMMEQSLAKYSNSAYGAYQPQLSAPAASFYAQPGQPGQPGINGHNYSAAPYQQQQYAPVAVQGQAPVAPYQQDSQYAPYIPQQQQQQQQQQPPQQLQTQPQMQPQSQPQQPSTFDQTYQGQSQPIDYNVNGAQPQSQQLPFSPQATHQQQQQQPLPPVQTYQGYQQQPQQQQPIVGNDFSGQQQQQQQQQQPTFIPQQSDNQNMYTPNPPASYGQQPNGFAPQPQFTAAAPFQ
ncbi:ESCRT-0 subunit protein hse1 [Entomortierella lignicola]|nr:ESCRT-0 subunit protein hse1 [Entomortierella lignicola]